MLEVGILIPPNLLNCVLQIHVELAGADQELTDITTNSLLNTNFLALGRELDILEPKTPDEVYKSHLGRLKLFVMI